MVLDGLNLNWNIQYAEANIGVGYILNKWRIKPYFSTSPYFGYILKANQSIGSDNYDIKKNNSLKTTDFGLTFSPGLKIALSNSISFYADYKYILGLQNLEKSGQKSFNRGFSINLGVCVTIINYNYVSAQ
jgi:opacity protein-like surface antigen